MVNGVLRIFDRLGLTRILSLLIYAGYRKRGKNIRDVTYDAELRVWIFQIDKNFFISRAPGWAYELDFLTKEYKRFSGFAYQPKPGDVIIDVGAGIGEETFLFSKWIGAEGKVYSIEANHSTYKILNHLVDINKLVNVQTDLLALSDYTGTTFIEDDDELYLQNTIGGKSRDTNQTEIGCYTLDDYFNRNMIKEVDFLRVNIEGAEQLLIRGMDSSIKKIKNVSISCHDFRKGNDFYITKEKVINFLKQNNFSVSFQKSGNPVQDNYLYGSNNLIF